MAREQFNIRMSDKEKKRYEISAQWLGLKPAEFVRKAMLGDVPPAKRAFRVDIVGEEMQVFLTETTGEIKPDGQMSMGIAVEITETLAAFGYPSDWVCESAKKIGHNFFCVTFRLEL